MDLPFEAKRLIKEVSEYVGIDPESVTKKHEHKTNSKIGKVRKLLMYFLVKELNYTLKEAAKVCEIKNHTSIIYLIKEALVEMERDVNFLILYHRAQKDYSPVVTTRKTSSKKSIVQYSLKGRRIKKWESVEAAATHFNVSTNSIRTGTKEGRSSVGYKWKYET